MASPEHGAHLALHGTPDPLEAGAHPRLAVPVDAPLTHVTGARFEVQRPTDPAAGEGPIERLAPIAKRFKGCTRSGFLRDGQSPLHPSVPLGAGGRAVPSHARILDKNR